MYGQVLYKNLYNFRENPLIGLKTNKSSIFPRGNAGVKTA